MVLNPDSIFKINIRVGYLFNNDIINFIPRPIPKTETAILNIIYT